MSEPSAYAWRGEGLHDAAAITRAELETIGYSFQERVAEPDTHEKASRWLPKKEQVDSLCSIALLQIDRVLKNAAASNSDTAIEWKVLAGTRSKTVFPALVQDNLRSLLAKTSREVFAIDSSTYLAFRESGEKGADRMAAIERKLQLPEVPFQNGAEAVLALMQLRNAWLQLELRMATLFHEQTSSLVLHCMDYDVPIVSQSSELLRPGGYLRIDAGVGRISVRGQPKIYIQGKEVALNEYGMAVWKHPVSGKPGTYSLPVRIVFRDQDGKEQTVLKRITYEVLACSSDTAHL